MHRILAGAASAAALLVAAPAHALSTATTTLSDLRITLTDLAPDDGVTPTLVLAPGLSSIVSAGAADPGANDFRAERGSGAFGAASVSHEVEGTGGSASVDGDPLGGGALVVTEAHGASPWGTGVGEFYVDGSGALPSFVLPGHSEVSLTGLAQIAWNASAASADASGYADVGFWVREGDDLRVLEEDQLLAGDAPGEGASLSGTASRQLSSSWRNDTDSDLVLGFFIEVVANASEENVPPPPASVPEPLSAALMPAALAALSVLRRRQ